jgi:hypothetical protein
MYRAYYDEDPLHRVPPIPTTYIPAIGGREGLITLKSQSQSGGDFVLRPSPRLVESIQRSLWEGMRALERDIAAFPARDGVQGATGESPPQITQVDHPLQGQGLEDSWL